MTENTEREQELLQIIDTLLKALSIHVVYEQNVNRFLQWREGAFSELGFGQEYENKVLDSLRDDYGVDYRKVTEGEQEITEDG